MVPVIAQLAIAGLRWFVQNGVMPSAQRLRGLVVHRMHADGIDLLHVSHCGHIGACNEILEATASSM